MTISAILPNYNMAEFLQRSLRSLVTQSVPFHEIIVVDDASQDDSVAVINQFKDKYPHIKLVRHERNQGVNPALNTGLQHATGDYVLLCAADDYYGQTLVERATEAIKQYPELGIVCGDAVVERFDLNKPFYRMLPYPAKKYISANDFSAIANKSFVCFNSGGGTVMKRSAVMDAGMLVNETRWHGDWVLYFVVAFRHGIYYVNDLFIHIMMRKKSYSEGKYERDIQDKVMLTTLHAIYQHYPDVWPQFKSAGLLPHYAMRYIALLMKDPIGRRFMTRRLFWKLLVNNKAVERIGRWFPYQFILSIRKLLKA